MRKILLFVMMSGLAWAQGPQPVTPLGKCIINFTINSTGTGATGHFQPSTTGYDNRQSGCANWAIEYSSTGYTVISLVVQSAESLSNVAPGTPDTYGTYAGSVVTGVNPNTATTHAATTLSGYYPWIRINAATLTGTGTIVGTLIGTLPIDTGGGNAPTPGSGCVGTIASPCIVAGPGATGAAVSGSPVRIGGSDGTNTRDIKTDTSGNQVVVGTKTGNAAVPGANNVGVLSGTANAAAPTYTETFQVPFSFDLAGNVRVIGSPSGTQVVSGNKTNNNAVPGATNIGALICVANATAPTYTETFQTLCSQNLTGFMRTTPSTVAASTIDGIITPTMPANDAGTRIDSTALSYVFNGSSWDRFRSAGVTGTASVGGAAAAGTAIGSFGNPVLIGISDGANVFRLRGDANGRLIQASSTATPVDGVTNASIPVQALGGGGVVFNSQMNYWFNGATWDRQYVCASTALLNTSSTGNIAIVAASGSTVIRICHISVSTTAPEDIKLVSGAGATCGIGTADLTGLYKSVQSFDFEYGASGALRTPASSALCINQSVAQTIGVTVTYAQF